MRAQPTVFLHVGVPKSGTSFLQSALCQNLPTLAAAGFHFPDSPRTHALFRAAVEVRSMHESWGLRPEIDGTWARLCADAMAFEGTSILSHELFGGARPEQIARALEPLAGADLHLVVTARDLGRQLTADWQEGVKHGRTVSFEEFRRRVSDPERRRGHAVRFWGSHDLPALLTRWGAHVPAEKVHVVTGPPSSAGPLELWRRFCEAVGLDPSLIDPTVPGTSNGSLGTAQIALLRRVNRALDDRIAQPTYGQVVKRRFAQELLTAQPAARPVLPADMYDEVRAVSERWVKEIDAAGYTVHGELAELLPQPPRPDAPHPDEVSDAAQLESAATVIADLLVEVAALRGDVRGLESRLARLRTPRGLVRAAASAANAALRPRG